MAIADKIDVEDRRAPGFPWRCRRRARGLHHPARLRGAHHRQRRGPQHHAAHAGVLRGERVFAAGDEIEGAHLAPQVEHDGTKRIAGQCIGTDAQRHLVIGRLDQHDAARIEAEFLQPAHRQRATFAGNKILPDPEQRFCPAQPLRHARDKACGRTDLLRLQREHFVQRAADQTALQR